MSRRLVFWLLLLAVILGFGWFKSVENRRDRRRQTAWQARIERLQRESSQAAKQYTTWLRLLHSQPDARCQIEARLNDGQPLEVRPEGEYKAAAWTDPKYGIRLELDFYGDKLVASGVTSGTSRVVAVNPQPPRVALASRAESIRRVIAHQGVWLWVAASLLAVLSRKYGLAGAEAMLAASLACGAAWLVAPNYTLEIQGVLSNDPLALAAMMYLSSLVALAFRVAPRADRPLKLQFRLRTLLAFMGAVAILLAMGVFGYLALGVLLIGAAVFWGTLHALLGRRSPNARAETTPLGLGS